jgi:hypothetical protein
MESPYTITTTYNKNTPLRSVLHKCKSGLRLIKLQGSKDEGQRGQA